MKGVVFTEFLEMVERRFSADMVDDIIEDSALSSRGAYTSVGTYDHREMVALVSALARRSGIATPDLLKAFGETLFQRFSEIYPDLIDRAAGALAFLSGIETIVHAEVRKLYPDAQLPTFDVQERVERRLVLLYRSDRHFEDLAEGLILGCLRHFGEQAILARETVGEGPNRAVRFVVTRVE